MKIAILTPFLDENYSAIIPGLEYVPGRKWDYYHICLEKLHNVTYVELDKWQYISSFDVVFVHERFYEQRKERLVESIQHLKKHNGRVYWVEMHEKSLYSKAIFEPGFMEVIDRIFKHQLLDFSFLREQLQNPRNNLAPYLFFGSGGIREYYKKPSYFNFNIDDSLIDQHLVFPFEQYQNKIEPIMYPFSWELIKNGVPSYTRVEKKEVKIGYAGRPYLSHVQRNALCCKIEQAGGNIWIGAAYLYNLAFSEFFMGLGHIHSSLRTFDTLAIDTVLIHYQAKPYRMWEEFKEYETFLPCGNPHEMFGEGGFGFTEKAERMVKRLLDDVENKELKREILGNQKELFDKITNPSFICEKLGVWP